jgi:hypothetical protein
MKVKVMKYARWALAAALLGAAWYAHANPQMPFAALVVVGGIFGASWLAFG